MTSHLKRSISLAEQITAKAEEAVSDLDREMALRKWPAEFRVLMWDAVVIVAQSRASEARGS